MKKTMKKSDFGEVLKELRRVPLDSEFLTVRRDDGSLTVYTAPTAGLFKKRLGKTMEGKRLTDLTGHIQKALDGETVIWDD